MHSVPQEHLLPLFHISEGTILVPYVDNTHRHVSELLLHRWQRPGSLQGVWNVHVPATSSIGDSEVLETSSLLSEPVIISRMVKAHMAINIPIPDMFCTI